MLIFFFILENNITPTNPMKHLKIIVVLSFLCYSTMSQAQQTASWSSFYENGFIWNPALTARWNAWELSATLRQEWSGFQDAPEYGTVGFQYPFIRNKIKTTIGAYAETDKVGPYESVGLGGTYTYKLYTGLFGIRDGVLTLGLGAKINQFRFNALNLVSYDGIESDFTIPEDGYKYYRPNVSFGVFYNSVSDFYSHFPHFYFGASITNALPYGSEIPPYGSWQSVPHVHLHGGMRLKKSKRSDSYVEPSVMVSYAYTKVINVMANVRYEKEQKYWAAIGGVSNGEVFAQAGLIFNDQSVLGWLVNDGLLRIGTKVDYSLGSIGQFAGMGYEAYVAYMFSEEPY